MIKTLIEKLKTLCLYFVSKRYTKSWDKMTLIEQWQYARNTFKHYAIRSMYDYGDGFRTTVSQEERNWCAEQANIWDKIIKDLRLKLALSDINDMYGNSPLKLLSNNLKCYNNNTFKK